ncbi:hypothetical protein M7I_6786 [Glarea lozoyensis 74030]|uniref:DUF590-domain-containing protein n=1 Tax=Glarea lozoyensis (strain ATCC 74030 / MF5533) TaxID=1104152 RepID=H0EVI8_GLAL7|nr:hypothetical protein M7I_6786 [Glarea lozoyensis 74030]
MASVDFVIDYRFATTSKQAAESQFTALIHALNSVGLTTEVRNGDNCAVLIFIKVASPRHLRAEVYRSRVQDWLYGVRTIAPEKDMQKAFTAEPIIEAERLRLVYLLITKPKNEGETDLAVQWGVKGVSKIQHKRPDFKHESVVRDPITDEEVKVYSPVKRLSRQMLQVPFALAAALILGTLIATCFSIEVFISEVYGGPFKSYLVFLPTVILTVAMPTLSAMLTGFAAKLTDLENYETVAAFVYVPFAQVIVPYLDVFQLAVKPFAENEKQMTAPKAGFQINPDRLKKQVIYFTVTAQIVGFALELVVPYIMRTVFKKVKEVKADRASKKGGATATSTADDHPEESAFLVRVRNEAELSIYDVTTDFREMIVQFGYLSLFSVVWPLTAVSFIINNWIELRGDALKIALETQRPVPWRADSIGPWLDALGFLSWLGSLTSAALVYLFNGNDFGPGGNPSNIKIWGLLLTIFFSEHLYLGIQLGIRTALGKIDSPGLQKERSERFAVRKQYLAESMGQEAAEEAAEGGIAGGEKINRKSLEDEARDSTLQGHGTPEERFWGRQRGVDETLTVGRRYIQQAAPKASPRAGGEKKEL